MFKKSLKVILGMFFLAAMAFVGTGCGGCGDGETEVCGVLETFGKNGFVDDCVCVQAECQNDDDCEAGFFCDGGLCQAN